jgi:PBP1b-binding outer membrane lipoprotein LpoB
MKIKQLGLIVLILVAALVLVGCARPEVIEEAPEPPVVEQPAVVEPTETEPPVATDPPTEEPVIEATDEPTVEPTLELDDEDERMQALISDKIGGCHMLNFILRQNKTREEWSVTIDRMIGKGADVNAEEKELIIDYLVSRNP